MFDLYENIKGLAQAHGYSPSGLCLALGLSKSTLSNLRRGRADTLSQSTLRSIAEFLGEDYDLVAHGKRDETEPPFIPDVEVVQILEDMRDNSSVRVLLHSAKNATPSQLSAVAGMLKSLKDSD